jgi:hypothetical protein
MTRSCLPPRATGSAANSFKGGVPWDSGTPGLRCRCHRHLPGPRPLGLGGTPRDSGDDTTALCDLADRSALLSWGGPTTMARSSGEARSESRAPGGHRFPAVSQPFFAGLGGRKDSGLRVLADRPDEYRFKTAKTGETVDQCRAPTRPPSPARAGFALFALFPLPPIDDAMTGVSDLSARSLCRERATPIARWDHDAPSEWRAPSKDAPRTTRGVAGWGGADGAISASALPPSRSP